MSDPTFNPEYLEDQAQQLRDAGAIAQASQLDECVKQWRAEQRALAESQADATRLQHKVNTAARSLAEAE